MVYLATKHVVHRDLAARNILLDVDWQAKVADFGLSREVKAVEDAGGPETKRASLYYRSNNGMFPVRWTSPEAMQTAMFTEGSDVWSFGVVLVEIFQDGAEPYGDIPTANVIYLVEKGERINRADIGCSIRAYNVLKMCWEPAPEDRPTFSELLPAINQLLGEADASQRELPGTVVGSGDGIVQDNNAYSGYREFAAVNSAQPAATADAADGLSGARSCHSGTASSCAEPTLALPSGAGPSPSSANSACSTSTARPGVYAVRRPSSISAAVDHKRDGFYAITPQSPPATIAVNPTFVFDLGSTADTDNSGHPGNTQISETRFNDNGEHDNSNTNTTQGPPEPARTGSEDDAYLDVGDGNDDGIGNGPAQALAISGNTSHGNGNAAEA